MTVMSGAAALPLAQGKAPGRDPCCGGLRSGCGGPADVGLLVALLLCRAVFTSPRRVGGAVPIQGFRAPIARARQAVSLCCVGWDPFGVD